MQSVDQLGNHLTFTEAPKKIISLVPSISELLWDLNLQNELCGITKFCIHPDEMYRTKTRVGGTKNIDPVKIGELKPDLIIANKEENTFSDINLLKEKYPVWISDVNSVEDAFDMIHEIGKITDTSSESEEIISKMNFSANTEKKLKIIYLIWNEPLMAVGKNTFIDAMIDVAGFENVISKSRYPQISLDEIAELNPDYLFLSTEPFPFKENHKFIFSNILSPEKIKLVDGEMFSWYGSRMRLASDYFEKLRNEL